MQGNPGRKRLKNWILPGVVLQRTALNIYKVAKELYRSMHIYVL